MIIKCPNCGHDLLRPIRNGVKSCLHCHAFFEANKKSKLLSASWELRRNANIEQVKYFHELTDEEAQMLYHYIVDNGYTHDEVLKLLSA